MTSYDIIMLIMQLHRITKIPELELTAWVIGHFPSKQLTDRQSISQNDRPLWQLQDNNMY